MTIKLNFKHFLLLIVAISTCVQSICALPLVMAPKIFRLYTQENIVVLPLTEEAFLLEIKSNDQVLFTKYFPKSPKNPFSVPIELGANVTTGVAKLSVINRDGDENSSQIIISGDTGFGFVQTDKPIYTPKEKVKIRLMRLDDDLKPMADRVKLSIKNPHKITMDEVILEATKDDYFINYEFKIPPDPIKNKWSIIMAYGPEFQVTTNVTFEVREYILPLFKVALKSPKFITPSTAIINGSVSAHYLTGQPVTGSVRFKFKVRDASNRTIGIGQTDELELVKGETSYKFSADEFSESEVDVSMIIGGVLVVEATVIEAATRQKVKQIDTSTHFVASPYRVSFDSSFRVFRPEHPIRLIAELFDVHNQPVIGIPTRLSIFSSRMVTHDVVSDDLGRVAVDYNTSSQDKKLIFEVRTRDPNLNEDEQSFSRLLVERSNQTSASLTLVKKADRFKVGDRYDNSIIFEGSTFIFSQAYYITVVRGRIDKLERIPDNDNFGFTIEPHMAPSFRLITVSYRFDRIVSDSLLINVDPSECVLNVSYVNSKGANTNIMEPGENGTLIVTSDQSKSRRKVSIIGVDEAVYLLRSSNTLTRHALRKMFNSKDKGCGPGGGNDPTDVLLNSGLVIAGIPSHSSGSNCAPKKDKPSRRRPVRSPRILISPSSSNRRFVSSPTFTSSRSTSTVSASELPAYSTNTFINQCCHLGKIKPNRKAKAKSCEERRDILLRSVKNTECAQAFYECCYNSVAPPLLRTSVFNVNVGGEGDKSSEPGEPAVSLGQEDAFEESTLIRQDFRETWLFDLVTLEESQTSVAYPVTTPHSITSWRLNALSLSAQDGLCLMDKPLRLISTKDLHIRVDLPYSIVVNEQVEMLVTLFNHGPTRKKVNLFMYGVEGVCSEADAGQKTERRLVTVEPGVLHTEGFALSPIRTGEFKIQIDALAHGTSDVVIKTLHVVPQGIPVVDNYAVQLDPRNLQHRQKRSIKRENLVDSIDPDKGEQKTRIDLVPKTQSSAIVPDSEECVVSAIADSYGPSVVTSLSNVEHLIAKPTGCGEQNVIRMAPTLFTLDYLNSTGRLTSNQREMGMKYLKSGYENQMMFRKPDGSYSTFEKRPSSLWLTAFVTRIMCKAAPFLGSSLDPEVILSSIDYLVDHQQSSPSGSWKEYQPIIHKSALGGLTGIIPITAFTYNTLRTCDNFTFPRILSKRRDKALKLAESYLCGKLTSELIKGDPYHVALLAYSLSTTSCLQSVDRRKQLVSRLREISVYSANENKLFWNTSTPIETTGYVLQAFLNLREAKPEEVQSILNYLESQRSYTGAFDATQDTIVALEALSNYAKSSYNLTDINLVCNITSGRFRKSIEFHEDNAQVMRTFEMNNECDYIDMVTRGTGLGSVRVKYKYNVLEAPEKLCGFELDVNVTHDLSPNEFNSVSADAAVELDDLFNITMLAEIGVLNERLVQVETIVNSTLTELGESSNPPGPSYSGASKTEPTTTDYKFTGTSKVTNKLTVCAKRFDSTDSGMVILEVGILSGYVPDENDLAALRKNNPFISSHEKTARSVIFYLEDVSADQQYCLSFKIYQENKVANLQSAMVKIYDYYKKGQGCSQLYHSTRRTDYLKKICNSSICHCTARWICPLNDNIIEVGEIGSVNIIRAREKFTKLLCSGQYGFVWLGRFVKQTELDSLVLLHFKIGQSLYGEGQEGQDFTVTMDRSCFDPSVLKTTYAEKFLIMGKSRNSTAIHLDSRSIAYDLEDVGTKDPKIHFTIKRVIDDLKRSRRQLTC